jgi:hypothetical protein
VTRKNRKIIIIVISCCVLIVCGMIAGLLLFADYFVYSNDRDNRDPNAQEEMLQCTLEWGRFAPIPDSKTQFQIRTEGSAFTRSFWSSFYLPEEDLEKWMKDCPGFLGAETEEVDNTTTKYVIRPGGGAMYAEAVIDYTKCYVEIYVYWS